MNSLKGRWILIDRGEHYHIGQVEDINGDYILIKLSPPKDDHPEFYHVYHLSELSCECRECVNSYFFDTKEQLAKWIEYADKADEPGADNVLNMPLRSVTPPPWEKH